MLQSLLAFMMFKESYQETTYVNFSKENAVGQPTTLRTDRATYLFYKKKIKNDARKFENYKNSTESIYVNFFMKAFNTDVKGKAFDVKGDEINIHLRPFCDISLSSPLNIFGQWGGSRFYDDGIFENYICQSSCKLKNTRWNINVQYENTDICRVDLDDICTFTVNIGLGEYYTNLVGENGKIEKSYEVIVMKKDHHQKNEIAETIIKNEVEEKKEDELFDLEDQFLNLKFDE